ncbi:hypothetical protein A8990_14512 [Paenibacillus taihuensis]|uniref:ABC-2 type transport system permease protein n=1 Tax=Paenibacillus taihuensis TaxID=1156355 RepID=A0A3D9QVF4_9BACL|nr:hypothetical protein [Paenibacillus taihuensis]REE67003.1 hypothetical protein A8990_14512 [Paenibacillus taihuensis]
MHPVQGVVKMYMREKMGWVLLPWIILGSSFFINLFIAALMPMDEHLTTGGIASIFVYMGVIGILSMSQTFPFALGLSVRRKDFFAGTILMAVMVSLFTSIVLYLLSYIEGFGLVGWGVQLYFFHLPYLSEGNVAEQILVFFSISLCLFVTGFTIGCFFRRFGKIGMTTLAIVSIGGGTLLSYMATYFDWWVTIGHYLADLTAVNMAYTLLPISVVLGFIAYLLLRRATA